MQSTHTETYTHACMFAHVHTAHKAMHEHIVYTHVHTQGHTCIHACTQHTGHTQYIHATTGTQYMHPGI